MIEPNDFDPTNNHEIGTVTRVSAAESENPDAKDEHVIELYDPPASNGIGLKWKCENCIHIYADPTLFERDECVSRKL